MDADLHARLTYEIKLLEEKRAKCIAQIDILEPYYRPPLYPDVTVL